VSDRPYVATTSLAGCFGCHMSFLDIDERIVELAEAIHFDRTPLTDIKQLHHCRIGLIEGGVGSEENLQVLQEYRARCEIVVAVGACAINGGIPALRNHFELRDCLREVYLEGMGVDDPQIPDDPELPRPLPRLRPIHELVKVDYSLPGCPPPAEAIWKLLQDLLAGREPVIPSELLRYD